MRNGCSKPVTPGRVFYRYIIKVEVLTDKPMPELDLESIAVEMMEGELIGIWSIECVDILNSKQTVEAMLRNQLDTSFFDLSPTGDDMKEE